MNPYELTINLRNNRVLFQYLEEVSVSYKEDELDWTIKGESSEGTTYIYNTSSDVLRIVLPISVPKEIPVEALYKIISSTQPKFEGILGIAIDDNDEVIIEYYIHSLLDEGLDRSLIKFTQERKELKEGFTALQKDIKELMSSMQEVMHTKGRVPNNPPNSFNTPNSNTEDIWSTMADIENKINKKPFSGIQEPKEKLESDKFLFTRNSNDEDEDEDEDENGELV